MFPVYSVCGCVCTWNVYGACTCVVCVMGITITIYIYIKSMYFFMIYVCFIWYACMCVEYLLSICGFHLFVDCVFACV